MLGATEDIISEVTFDLMREAAADALLVHNSAFEYKDRFVQLECLNKVEYNGRIGYVLGAATVERFAVYVPSLGFRLSLTPKKFRVLSSQEFRREHEWFWEHHNPEYHSNVEQQIKIFKQEQISSMADVGSGSVFKIKR